MNILINCSNLKVSGGLQVADSVCGQLSRFSAHNFFVVLSKYLDNTKERIQNIANVEVFTYDIPNSFYSIIMGRDKFLDGLVEEKRIDAVLTIFGPSRWCPRVKHLCGFAMPALVIPESPFFTQMSSAQRLKWKLWCIVRQWSFQQSANYFWTENPFISERVKKLLRKENVYTVSNYYNQVFDTLENWRRSKTLPSFKGITCLSVSSPIGHKNFKIILDVLKSMKRRWPEFKVRFVLTFNSDSLDVPADMRDYFVFVGKVDVSECPYLYEQADIMFMPTLLECFTATYPEAMRMEVPIVTTDLEFARGLCGDAACYYSAVDAKAAADAIYKVAMNKDYARQLIENGKKQLMKYDNYERRAEKLVKILEEITID